MAQLRNHEFGVFLPVANGGWIISSTTPPLDGLWKQNLAASITADQVGMDFVMSMGKWRGFGGVTDHWGTQMESVTMMAAIAQATRRVKVWATVHTLLHNPAVVAKMITTLDHISGGRAGLNIVAGAYKAEFEQLGAGGDSLEHDERYALAEEWTAISSSGCGPSPASISTAASSRWTTACSNPKPLSQPHPELICAGMSDRGFDFAVREADACFIGGRTAAERQAASRRAKQIAQSYGKQIKTYAMCTVVHAETDGEAEALARRYAEGVDLAAVVEMLAAWGVAPERLESGAAAQGAFMTETEVGSPATCADKIEEFLTYAELDGLMLIFPDYVEGLKMFGADILPGLQGGLRMNDRHEQGAPADGLADWLAPGRTALLIIDMQADFASPDGALGKAGVDLSAVPAALAAAERLVAAARAAGTPVIFIGLQTQAELDSAAWRERDAAPGRRRRRDGGRVPGRNAGLRLRGPPTVGRRAGGEEAALQRLLRHRSGRRN